MMMAQPVCVCVCAVESMCDPSSVTERSTPCVRERVFLWLFFSLSLSPAGGELLGGSTKSFTWCRILSFSFISSCTAQLLLFRFTTTLSLLKFTNLFSSSSSHLPDVVRVGTRSGHGGQTVAPTCGRRRWWRDEPSLRYTHSRPRSLESQPIVTRPVIKAVDDLYGGNQGDSWRREKLGCGHLSLVEGKKEKNKRNWAGRYIHTYAAVCSKGKVIINTFYLLQTYTHVIFRVGPWNKKKKELRKSQVL